MTDVIAVTGPIFLLIALGYAAVRRGLPPRDELRPLGAFVINLALPALLFRALAGQAPGQLIDPALLAAYAAGSLAAAGLAALAARLLLRRAPAVASVVGFGSAMSNSAFIGYPIAHLLAGRLADQALAAYVLVENLLLLPLVLLLAESLRPRGERHWAQRALQILRRLAGNPLILAIIGGLFCGGLGLPLPALVERALGMLAAATAPLALFYIGGLLAGERPPGRLPEVALIAAGKLLLHPLLVAAALAVWPPATPALASLAVLNAGMPMLSIYPILGQAFGQEKLCALALVAATLLAFVSLNGLLLLTGSALPAG